VPGVGWLVHGFAGWLSGWLIGSRPVDGSIQVTGGRQEELYDP